MPRLSWHAGILLTAQGQVKACPFPCENSRPGLGRGDVPLPCAWRVDAWQGARTVSDLCVDACESLSRPAVGSWKKMRHFCCDVVGRNHDGKTPSQNQTHQPHLCVLTCSLCHVQAPRFPAAPPCSSTAMARSRLASHPKAL